MAELPYTSDIISKRIAKDLATRLYQFMQLNKIIDCFSVLNDGKQNNADLLELGKKLEDVYIEYMQNDTTTSEKALKVLDDNNSGDTVGKIVFAESDKEKLEQIRIYLAQKIGKTIFDKTQGFIKKDKASVKTVALDLTDTLTAVLKKENKNIDAADLANRTISGTLEPQEISVVINLLQSAKQKVLQRMKTDWKTYENSRTPDPNIEKFRKYFESTLTENITFEYKTYPESRNVLLCIRDDFADRDTGSKTAFLKMTGLMLDCGHKQFSAFSPLSAKTLNNNNYKQFIELIKATYPNDFDTIINAMLEVSATDNLEQARRAAFDKKSKELYGKFLSAVLVKKKQQNDAERVIHFDYQGYINKGVAGYITDMKDGKNNIAANLHLTDESKSASIKELIDDTAEKQIISVHHKIPVASAVPLYLMQHGELHSPQKAQKLFEELSKTCPEAVKNRTSDDIVTIGFAMAVFPEEARRDNPAAILRIPDKNKRERAQQIYDNKKAIRQLYKQYFPLDYAESKKIKEEILRIVNNPSNHTLPIGNTVHQKMEPNGNGNISKQDDNLYINVENTSKIGITTTDKINNSTIFAAEYDIADLREVVRNLNKNFKDGLEKTNPLLKQTQPQHQIISSRVTLNMSETKFMRKMRSVLNMAKRITPITYLKNIIGLKR